MAERDHMERHRDQNARIRDAFTATLRGLGLKPYPSPGNFVLVRFPGGAEAAEAARLYLLKDGIVVRPMVSYDLNDCLRVTLGDDADMKAVCDSLAQWDPTS